MVVIDTRLIVDASGTLSSAVRLEAGEYFARREFREAFGPGSKLSNMTDFPVHDLGWGDDDALQRERVYGDDEG